MIMSCTIFRGCHNTAKVLLTILQLVGSWDRSFSAGRNVGSKLAQVSLMCFYAINPVHYVT